VTTLSTHVLDTRLGVPAEGMSVALSRRREDGWEPVFEAVTDSDGRVGDFGRLDGGVYRLVFETGAYGNDFYPFVAVTFKVETTRNHLHVPLLLSPYGYTTYRGS
jgi:5-hydroxyisourate hydrolase